MNVPLSSAIDRAEALQKELGIYVNKTTQEKKCFVYLIHHGSTDWSDQSRLQGWKNLPLNDKGKEEIRDLAKRLDGIAISKIYSSPLQSAYQTSEILKNKFNCNIEKIDQLKGEYHGKFEGFTKAQYMNESHFKDYDDLPPLMEIFFPCGENGESKAEVAKRLIPALKKIAAQHLGENIAVVTHGGLFKILNFYLGTYSEELGTISIPNGETILIEVDQIGLYLKTNGC